jgi:hypothetical protein
VERWELMKEGNYWRNVILWAEKRMKLAFLEWREKMKKKSCLWLLS